MQIVSAVEVAEPDGSDVWLLVMSGLFCLKGISQFVRQASVLKLGGSRRLQLPLYLAWALSFAGLALASKLWTASEVRGHNIYVFLIIALGGVLLMGAGHLFRWFGISLREDVFERRNLAASLALSGAVIGTLLVYAGSNLGEGPSFWNNAFCVLLGIPTWFGLWLVLELGGRVAASITEERDIASGIRLAGFLTASGLILARALAGDWHSVEATVHDFKAGISPVLLLVPIAVFGEWTLRPTGSKPKPSWISSGLLVAAAYVAIAAAWLWHLGWWEGAPR